MTDFDPTTLRAAAAEREVILTTEGRTSGQPAEVTIWVATDGSRIFIRSGKGLGRHWPRNLLASGAGTIRFGDRPVKFSPRLITDPEEARAVSSLYQEKYGDQIKPSAPTEPLTDGEKASFELTPAL